MAVDMPPLGDLELCSSLEILHGYADRPQDRAQRVPQLHDALRRVLPEVAVDDEPSTESPSDVRSVLEDMISDISEAAGQENKIEKRARVMHTIGAYVMRACGQEPPADFYGLTEGEEMSMVVFFGCEPDAQTGEMTFEIPQSIADMARDGWGGILQEQVSVVVRRGLSRIVRKLIPEIDEIVIDRSKRVPKLISIKATSNQEEAMDNYTWRSLGFMEGNSFVSGNARMLWRDILRIARGKAGDIRGLDNSLVVPYVRRLDSDRLHALISSAAVQGARAMERLLDALLMAEKGAISDDALTKELILLAVNIIADDLIAYVAARRDADKKIVNPEPVNDGGGGGFDGISINGSEWAAKGSCRTVDSDSLFVQGAAQNRAKTICMTCPVRTECLAEALDNRIEFGVWGGMTERERRALLKRRSGVRSWSRLLAAARLEHEL